MSLDRSKVVIHKNLDDFHVWQAKYRHWMFEVAESGAHEIWVATRDLREFLPGFPDDRQLKSMCPSFMLYAKDLKVHFIQEKAMQRVMGQVPRLRSSAEALKFQDWFERNIGSVARTKRKNRALDEHNEITKQRSREVMVGPVPRHQAPPHLEDPTRPLEGHEKWRLQAASGEPPRVYRPELRPMVMTWRQWLNSKVEEIWAYLVDVWRGERTLVETVLLGLLAGGVPLHFVDALISETVDFSRDYLWVLWINALVLPVALACAFWITVSLTRCTRRSLHLRGGKLWATTVFLAFIPTVPAVAGNGWDLELLEEWWDVVRGRNEPAQVYADPRLGRIVVNGEFRLGSAQVFEEVLKANRKYRLVQIESPGGYVAEGFRMAKLIEQYKLDTVSFEDCHSACTLLLVAGETRYLGSEVMVGFHRSGRKYGPVGSGWSWTDHRIADYYQSRGVQVDFIQRALIPSIRDIWIAPHAQMYEAGYATMMWSERPAGL